MKDYNIEYYDGACELCCGWIEGSKGEPHLYFKSQNLKESHICMTCYGNLIPAIYEMAGAGDGGIIHLEFKLALQSRHNRKHRQPFKEYRKVFKELLGKYNFSCVHCGEKNEKKLTIDHIHPVSKGGGDETDNLQILCKSCNSKKGAKLEVV